MEWITLHILAVLFFATVIRSGFGFGDALIAVPLLALVMPVEEAAPLSVLVSITVASVIILQEWQKVQVRSVLVLIIPTFFGIPLGLLLIAKVPEGIIKGILGVFIIGFSWYCLDSGRRLELKTDRLGWIFGFVAGVFGGAYGMNGPPLVIYGSLRRWSPEHFRATLQGYFLPASLAVLGGYWLAGLLVTEVTRYYLISLPLALAAIALGRWIHYRLDGRSFLIYVHAGLIVVGSILLIQAYWENFQNPLK